jgi:hypothetical protein
VSKTAAEAMREIAGDEEASAETRATAARLAGIGVVFDPQIHSADVAAPADPEFARLYHERVAYGTAKAKERRVAIVGMARDIAGVLPMTIGRVEQLGSQFARWSACVYENDSKDKSKEVLSWWASERPGQVFVELADHGREKLTAFEPERVQRYAEYRNRLREMVQRHCADAEYVIAVDFDAWGGWSLDGVMNGIAWHEDLSRAACMASTSLMQHAQIEISGQRIWAHYDAWAFRLYGWSQRFDPWFTLWIPPPGSPPMPVLSAFGGLAIYKAEPWLKHEYASDDGDIEHVGLHRRMIEGGWEIYLNPAQRCVMQWVPDGGGQHSDDQH